LLDEFVVERILGEGGMGKVYLVRSRSTGAMFAVKRTFGLQEDGRRLFLAELQTWIDLPEHANLVPCRFFRTVGDEVLIFAEYVAGGSLEEWIASRKLYDGGKEKALERMLDVAIQFAWGLHCLHERGLVHQDIKPGNVLIGLAGPVWRGTTEGLTPRLMDYGLARARVAAGERVSPEASHNILLSSLGGSSAYWSPEQAAGWRLTQKTDIWSWGVSILEMFTGGVTWVSGLTAAEVLAEHRRSGAREAAIPTMPGQVADLLSECFREDPNERLPNMGEAVDRLKAIYSASVDENYSHVLPEIERVPSSLSGVSERHTVTGATWTDPSVWLEKGLRAQGRDPAEAAAIISRRGATRQGKLVADIAVYDEAKQLYLRLVHDGHKELESDLAALCLNKAYVHQTAADAHGAIGEYDQAIAIWERLVNQDGRGELANDLASAFMGKASAVSDLGDICSAVTLCDQAIAIRDRLVNQEGRVELANDLASALMGKANTVRALGDIRSAVTLCDQAIAIRDRLVNQEGRVELANDLASALMGKANTVRALGDIRSAVTLYDQAIAIRDRLVNQEGRVELANDLASAFTGKAYAVSDLGAKRGSMALYDQAIAIRERLVNEEGRRELANEPAAMVYRKREALPALGDERGAVTLDDKVIGTLEWLVDREGRWELASDLAEVYTKKATALHTSGDNRGAVEVCEKAVLIWERLVVQEGRQELEEDLAGAYSTKGVALKSLGDIRGAVELYDRAIAIRERLLKELEGVSKPRSAKSVFITKVKGIALDQAIEIEDPSELSEEDRWAYGKRRDRATALAHVYEWKGSALCALGDNRGAVALYDQAIAIWEPLELCSHDLDRVYLSKARSLRALGDNCGAVKVYDQLIEIRKTDAFADCAFTQGRRGAVRPLAGAYSEKADVLRAQSNNRDLVALYDQAITFWEGLVNQVSCNKLAVDLAALYSNKAVAVSDVGDKRGAVTIYDQAIGILERLVNQEGRRDLVNNLAIVYMNKAAAAHALGDKRGAVTLFDQAIAIRERLVNQEGRNELAGDLASLRAYRGQIMVSLGDKSRGLEEMLSARKVLEAEISRTGRADLKQVLTWLNQQLGKQSCSTAK
jgi:tetratricopeptide (TPR) repeat protein